MFRYLRLFALVHMYRGHVHVETKVGTVLSRQPSSSHPLTTTGFVGPPPGMCPLYCESDIGAEDVPAIIRRV